MQLRKRYQKLATIASNEFSDILKRKPLILRDRIRLVFIDNSFRTYVTQSTTTTLSTGKGKGNSTESTQPQTTLKLKPFLDTYTLKERKIQHPIQSLP
jgi:hypothetical protein